MRNVSFAGKGETIAFAAAEEFPDFRDLHKRINRSPWRTCNQVFDEYLQQCESRLAKHDLSLTTVVGYRKALGSIWRPTLRALPFLQVRYSMLVKQHFFKDDGTSIRNLSNPAKRWRLSLERLGQRYRRPYCARHSSVSWNLMIGKNPLFVARQHGHSLVTMWRTYAAWMDGALESDIGLVRAAIEDSVPELAPSSAERDSAAQVRLTLAERLSNTESGLPRDGALVAEFVTRFVTRCGTLATQVPEDEEKESGGEGGIARGRGRPLVLRLAPDRRGQAATSKNRSAIFVEPTDGTLEIKKLLGNCRPLVPSKPLGSPFVPVDSASSRTHRRSARNLTRD